MQARVCSERLPGKAFFTFFGQTMIERACSIAKSIQGVDKVVLATGNREENQLLRPLAENMDVEFFVGDEQNVLERFAKVIESYQGEYLLRITCDNYLIQPAVIEGLYEQVCSDNADYGFVAPLSHFSGEIVRCKAIRECYAGHYSGEAKEHVTWDIRNSADTKITTLPDNFLGLDHNRGITLDTLDDLILLKTLEAQHPELAQPRCLESLISIGYGADK